MNLVYVDESGQPMKDTLNYFYVTALIVNVLNTNKRILLALTAIGREAKPFEKCPFQRYLKPHTHQIATTSKHP